MSVRTVTRLRPRKKDSGEIANIPESKVYEDGTTTWKPKFVSPNGGQKPPYPMRLARK